MMTGKLPTPVSRPASIKCGHLHLNTRKRWDLSSYKHVHFAYYKEWNTSIIISYIQIKHIVLTSTLPLGAVTFIHNYKYFKYLKLIPLKAFYWMKTTLCLSM